MRRLVTLFLAIPLLGALGAAPAAAEPPTTTEEFLAGMVTEEVEPGVFRVVNDGVRDISSAKLDRIVTGRDGSLWFKRGQTGFRLGAEVSIPWSDVYDFAVDPDGVVWFIEETVGKRGNQWTRLRSFDGEKWRTHKRVPARAVLAGLDVATDGTVWVAWRDPEARREKLAYVVAHLGPDGWHLLERPLEALSPVLRVTDSGEVWAYDRSGEPVRYLDGAWQQLAAATDEGSPVSVRHSVPGRDGTAWLARMSRDPEDATDGSAVMRFDGNDWQGVGAAGTFHRETGWPGDPTDNVPDYFGGPLRTAPDGSLWADGGSLSHSDGILHFDGSDWTRFLAGRNTGQWDIADDGSVWILERGNGPKGRLVDLYVITPEAVAGTE